MSCQSISTYKDLEKYLSNKSERFFRSEYTEQEIEERKHLINKIGDLMSEDDFDYSNNLVTWYFDEPVTENEFDFLASYIYKTGIKKKQTIYPRDDAFTIC